MQTHQLRVVALAAATLVASGVTAPAADHLLSGTVASAAGEKLGGVTVSAKAHGSTITTSVYTDEQGGYYFPPLPAGTYTVWAQDQSTAPTGPWERPPSSVASPTTGAWISTAISGSRPTTPIAKSPSAA